MLFLRWPTRWSLSELELGLEELTPLPSFFPDPGGRVRGGQGGGEGAVQGCRLEQHVQVMTCHAV